MKADEKVFSYELIQTINRVDEKDKCFRRAIRAKK